MWGASFEKRVDELRDCDSVSDFVVGMRNVATALGFSTAQLVAIRLVGAMTAMTRIEAERDLVRCDRAIEIGDVTDVQLPGNDPVIKRLRASPLPLIWGRDLYSSAGLADFYESKMVPTMNCNGIALRSTLPSTSDVHVLLMMQREDGIRLRNHTELAAALSLLACYGNDFADRVLWPAHLKRGGEISPLTPSQAECIYWAAQGLSVKETAKALGKSPATVANTVQAAMRRMDCTRKEQAVRLCLENKWFPAHLSARSKS